MKYKRLLLLLLIAGAFFPMIPTAAADQDTSLQDVISSGKLVIGLEAGYPPFETINATTDEFEGFDIDIANIICDNLGVEPEFVDTGWDVIFTSLATGTFDVIISAVSYTTERDETLDFSRWYYKSSQAVMVTVANPESILTVEDINVTGVIVGVQAGTTSDDYLDDTNATEVGYATITLAIQALDSGLVDAVLGDHATLLDAMKTQPGLFTVVDTFSPEDFAIPAQTGATALLDRINQILDGLLGDNLTDTDPDTQYNDIYNKWFDTDAIGFDDRAQDTSLQDVISSGTLVIGLEAGYPPFETINSTTDEFEGFDIDIANIICDDLGVVPDFVDTGWDVIFTSLATGAFDVIISAVSYTEERDETLDFSRWYYESSQAVMVPVANPLTILTVDDVNSSSVKVGIQAGTTSDDYLDDTVAQEVGFATITLAIEALKLGNVDAVLGDHATLLDAIKTQPGLFVVVDTFSKENFAIPAQEGATALLNRIDQILNGLLGNNITDPMPNTLYNVTYDRWFGEGSGEPTTNPVIPGFAIQVVIVAISVGAYLVTRKLKKRI